MPGQCAFLGSYWVILRLLHCTKRERYECYLCYQRSSFESKPEADLCSQQTAGTTGQKDEQHSSMRHFTWCFWVVIEHSTSQTQQCCTIKLGLGDEQSPLQIITFYLSSKDLEIHFPNPSPFFPELPTLEIKNHHNLPNTITFRDPCLEVHAPPFPKPPPTLASSPSSHKSDTANPKPTCQKL